MKTLTLFRAYVKATDDFWGTDGEHPRRYRQMNKLEEALTKRLQEQEEELERLREYEQVSYGLHLMD